jgi:alpha-tubulin suppressor-like RCC1 family protein
LGGLVHDANANSGETTQVTISISLGDTETVVFGPGSVALAVDVNDQALACGGCAPGDLCLALGNDFHRCATPCDPAADPATQCGGRECTLFSFTSPGLSGEKPLYVCNRVVAIEAGYEHVCAVRQSGAVACWGYNGDGQLGIGNTTSSSTPLNVSGVAGTVGVGAGASHTCAVGQSGALACWGYNVHGELGIGSAGRPALSPVSVLGPKNVVAVSAGHYNSAGGYYTCVLQKSGAVACWGDNRLGQLGDGTTSDTPVSNPFTVLGL